MVKAPRPITNPETRRPATARRAGGGAGGMSVLEIDGISVWFDGPACETTARNVAGIVKRYAERAGVIEIPLVTLSGGSLSGGSWWSRPWDEIAQWQAFYGEAGPSRKAEQHGVYYRCLDLMPNESPHPSLLDPKRLKDHPKDIVGVIVYEIAHLRWWNLPHGLEFSARVRALLRGAQFPSR